MGDLSEFYIEITENFIKSKIVVGFDGYASTIFYNVHKKYNPNEFNDFLNLMCYFRPEIDSCIKTTSHLYHVHSNKKHPVQLFISGNIKTSHEKIYFYGKHLQILPYIHKKCINIQLSGVWLEPNKFLNISNQTPYIFNITNPNVLKNNQIKILYLKYNWGYSIKNNVINFAGNDFLELIKEIPTTTYISDEVCNNLVLEWEIINDESE